MKHSFSLSRIFLAVAMLSSSAFFQTAQAKPAPYILQIHKHKENDVINTIALRNTSSGRIVWTRKEFFIRANWSSDRRAVIVEIDGGLLVWRQGFKPLRLNLPPKPRSWGTGNYDYTYGCVWSPDKKRFLVLGCAGSLSDGNVFCCQLKRDGTARYMSVSPQNQYVRKMKWRDNRTVVYWAVTFPNNKEKLTPHLWRVP